MPTFVEIPVVHGLNFNNLSNYQYPVDHYNYTATENSNSVEITSADVCKVSDYFTEIFHSDGVHKGCFPL